MANSRDLVMASPGSCYNAPGCSYGGVRRISMRQHPQWSLLSSRESRWESLTLGQGVMEWFVDSWVFEDCWLVGSGLPWWLSGKESACSAGNAEVMGSIPGLGRSPGGGNDNQLQYPCLGNPTDRGAWWATVTGLQRVRHDWAWMPTWLLGSEQLWLTGRRPGSVHLVWRCISELTVQ